jgi:hypothetical protein
MSDYEDEDFEDLSYEFDDLNEIYFEDLSDEESDSNGKCSDIDLTL